MAWLGNHHDALSPSLVIAPFLLNHLSRYHGMRSTPPATHRAVCESWGAKKKRETVSRADGSSAAWHVLTVFFGFSLFSCYFCRVYFVPSSHSFPHSGNKLQTKVPRAQGRYSCAHNNHGKTPTRSTSAASAGTVGFLSAVVRQGYTRHGKSYPLAFGRSN